MNLVHDYVAPTPAGGQCRIRLYIPEESEDSAVVICTEPTEGTGGMSITNCAEVLAAKVMESNRLQRNPVWIEHYEDGARGGTPSRTKEGHETFDLVNFASYEAREFVSVNGPEKRIGKPSWKALDRETVEALIGSPL